MSGDQLVIKRLAPVRLQLQVALQAGRQAAHHTTQPLGGASGLDRARRGVLTSPCVFNCTICDNFVNNFFDII